MSTPECSLKEKLIGSVEADEKNEGAKRQCGYHGKHKCDRGTSKQPVFGVFERDSRVYNTEKVPDFTSSNTGKGVDRKCYL